MIKKVYSILSVFCFFFTSQIAVADSLDNAPIGPVEGEKTGIYTSINYLYTFNLMEGNFLGNEDAENVKTEGVYGYGKNGNAQKAVSYKPSYIPSFLSGSAAIGYRLSEISRVEFEGSYLKANLNTDGYINDSQAYYLELKRDGQPIDPQYTGDEFKNITSIKDPQSIAFKLKNDGISHLAIIGKIIYEIRKKQEPLFAFVGIGAGLSHVNFLENSANYFAFQGEFGVGFELISNLTLTVSYKYFALADSKLTNIKPINTIKSFKPCLTPTSTVCPAGTTKGVLEKIESSSTATIDYSLGFNSVQAGIMFQF